MNRTIHGVVVRGCQIDDESRCAHYQGATDIVAIKFKCCGEWFPCHRCHAELADHVVEPWPRKQFDEHALLCGACGHQLTIHEYMTCASICPSCHCRFNPACARHRAVYFEA